MIKDVNSITIENSRTQISLNLQILMRS